MKMFSLFFALPIPTIAPHTITAFISYIALSFEDVAYSPVLLPTMVQELDEVLVSSS